MSSSIRSARNFIRAETGAVTAEFVIILPIILALIFLILFICLYLSAASDVQQVVHDLARYSFRFIGRPEASDLCASLRGEAVPLLVDASLLLQPEHFTLQTCNAASGPDSSVTITASYDFSGSLVQAIGKTFGLDIGIITRRSVFIP